MNRTVKDATIKVFHYPDLESLKAHIRAFVMAYNFAKHLQAAAMANPLPGHLRGLGKGPGSVQDQPAPPHPGTIHLVRVPCATRARSPLQARVRVPAHECALAAPARTAP